MTDDEARVGMICLDCFGDKVVIDRIVTHKYAEVGYWWNGSFSYEGDRVRLDELEFTGEFIKT